MRLRLVLCFIFAITFLARPAGADLPELIKRYIDDTTLIVGRLDVSELSDEAIIKFVGDLMREAPERERQRVLDDMRKGLEGMEEILAPLRERGITTSWFVMGPDSFVMGEPALNIIPVADDEQAKLITDLLDKERQDYRRVEGAVLVASRDRLDAAKNPRPVERPNLEKLISVGRSAPAFQMAFEPTPLVKIAAEFGARQLVAQSPEIPVEVIELVAAMETMSLTMGLPPRARATLSIDFPDTDTAELARKVLHEQVSRLEGQLKRTSIEAQRARELTAAFFPETKGKRVVLELSELELHETVGPVMVITMLQGREGGNRVRAGRNLRTITAAILLWSYEQGEGRLPPDLAAVEAVFKNPQAEGVTWKMVNRNPRFLAENAFAYVRPADRLEEIKEPDVTVIAYEKPPARGIEEGVNVAFADGKVEWLSAEDFEALARSQGFEIERLPR